MINLNNVYSYNQTTRLYMNRFIDEFLSVFPDILTKEELLSRLVSSVKRNILFKKLDNDVVGIFVPYDGAIICNELLDEKMLDAVLFHEFIHAITSNYQKTKCDYHLSNVYDGDKFLESIVSLMEHRFFNHKYGSFKGKNSSYVFDYAEQLESIFGKEFFSYFIKNYTDISPLFCNFNNNSSINFRLKKICYNVNEIHNLLHYSNNPEKVDYINFCLENDIALILKDYLKTSNLSDYEKLDKINNLFLLQKSPNLDIYIEMINLCKNKELVSIFPKLENICNIYKGISKGATKLTDKVSKYLSMKLFGFSNLIDNRNYEDSALKPFFQNQIFYMSLLNSIYQLDLDVSNLSFNEFSSISSSKNFSSLCIFDRLRSGKNVQHYYDNFSCLSRIKSNNLDCFIENSDRDVFVYKPCDIVKIISLLIISCNFNVIKSVVDLFKNNNINTFYYPVTVDGEINIPDYGEKIKLIYEKDDKIILEEYKKDKKCDVSYFLYKDSCTLSPVVLSQCSVKRR